MPRRSRKAFSAIAPLPKVTTHARLSHSFPPLFSLSATRSCAERPSARQRTYICFETCTGSSYTRCSLGCWRTWLNRPSRPLPARARPTLLPSLSRPLRHQHALVRLLQLRDGHPGPQRAARRPPSTSRSSTTSSRALSAVPRPSPTARARRSCPAPLPPTPSPSSPPTRPPRPPSRSTRAATPTST